MAENKITSRRGVLMSITMLYFDLLLILHWQFVVLLIQILLIRRKQFNLLINVARLLFHRHSYRHYHSVCSSQCNLFYRYMVMQSTNWHNYLYIIVDISHLEGLPGRSLMIMNKWITRKRLCCSFGIKILLTSVIVSYNCKISI